MLDFGAHLAVYFVQAVVSLQKVHGRCVPPERDTPFMYRKEQAMADTTVEFHNGERCSIYDKIDEGSLIPSCELEALLKSKLVGLELGRYPIRTRSKVVKSAICEMLGIEYPVFQGGMAWIADGKLAAAVSNGGGLGIIAAGNAPGEYVRQQIREARKLTGKPVGVNIMLLSPYADEVAKVVTEEKVEVVTTGAGNPSKYMKDWLAAGIKVIPVVASVALAKLMTRLGASAVIAEGGESGGHVGELTTMVLVPQICDATELPVIAAGGIADGRGVAAAFMLGACGVQMGTRFLSAEECGIHPAYKDKILKATDLCTMVTGRRLGHPVRSLRTPFARDYAKAEYGGMPDEELEALGTGALRRAVQEGDNERGCFLSGQIAAMVKKEQPAAEIVKEVMEEAEPLLLRASQWVK